MVLVETYAADSCQFLFWNDVQDLPLTSLGSMMNQISPRGKFQGTAMLLQSPARPHLVTSWNNAGFLGLLL